MSNAKKCESELSELLCADCKKAFDVPFDNGDGKVRCAGCAVDYYFQSSPMAGIAMKRIGSIDLNCGA